LDLRSTNKHGCTKEQTDTCRLHILHMRTQYVLAGNDLIKRRRGIRPRRKWSAPTPPDFTRRAGAPAGIASAAQLMGLPHEAIRPVKRFHPRGFVRLTFSL